jgi:hypothetical protein
LGSAVCPVLAVILLRLTALLQVLLRPPARSVLAALLDLGLGQSG